MSSSTSAAVAGSTSVNVRGEHRIVTGTSSEYVKLNVGGSLHYTTIGTLVKHDSMLRAMFSGRLEVLFDADGWILIDRCGKHFPVILNYLRDSNVALPDSRREVYEIMAEAKYYCIQGLIDACQAWMDAWQRVTDEPVVCRVPVITSSKEEKLLLSSSNKPCIKLLLNRHNNKYSYTSQSDDNLLRNLEMFEKLVQKFYERVLFIKDVGAAIEVCSWTFFGHGKKQAEVCCTSIVYATDKKHTKVEFPEARIYEEAMSILLFEPKAPCPQCTSTSSSQNSPQPSSTNALALVPIGNENGCCASISASACCSSNDETVTDKIDKARRRFKENT